MLVLVLEASTRAAKAMLYDSEKGILAVESENYTADMDKNGRQDTEQVYLATLRAGRKVAEGRDVAAIAVGGVWHSIAICDSAMRPVIRTHAWTFTGASSICREVRENKQLAKEIYNRTGCMPNVTYQPYTLKYLAENGLEVGEKLFSSQAGYNFFRMTGERLESHSIVSGMGLLNTHRKEYDDFILEFSGIKENQLAPLATYRDTRPLSPQCAERLGIQAGIPVVPPHPDGALNQVGNGAVHPGIMTFSVGTSAAIRLSTDRPVLSDPASTWCYVGVDGWMSGAATAGACNCINWFKETVLKDKWSFRELEETLLDKGETPVFLPFLFGERCPGWQDDRLGGFELLTGSATVPRMFQAICEGILFNVLQCYNILIDSAGVPERVIMSGGILNSPKWALLAANIFDRALVISDTAQASLLGGVVLAMHAAGEIGNLNDFSDTSTKILRPTNDEHETYQHKYQKYLECYTKMRIHHEENAE